MRALCALFASVLIGGLLGASAVASASGAEPTATLGDALEFGGGQLDPGGASDAQQARLASPDAFAARLASQTAYEGLSAVEAEQVDSNALPRVVGHQAGELPPLPSGTKVKRITGARTAQLTVEGKNAVLDSLAPIAVSKGGGEWTEMNLALHRVGPAFAPEHALVDVRLPERLQEGIALPGIAVSLTPMEGTGSQAASSAVGVQDGSSVFWGAASVGEDVDELARPTTFGAELFTVLRSPRSPETLRFSINMPAGAEVIADGGRDGRLRITDAGQALAVINPPTAQDAQGALVPVITALNGHILELHVDAKFREYDYPITVDPEVTDSQLLGQGATSNWKALASNLGYYYFNEKPAGLGEAAISGIPHARGEWAEYDYETQGESSIYKLQAWSQGWTETEAKAPDTTALRIVGSSAVEKRYPSHYGPAYEELCASGTCTAGNRGWGDEASLEQIVEESSTTEAFYSELMSASVEIFQEVTPSAAFEAGGDVAGYLNAASGNWINPLASETAVAIQAWEKGLGLQSAKITSPQELEGSPYPNPYRESAQIGGCSGAQCYMCVGTEAQCVGGNRPDGLPEVRPEPLIYKLTTASGALWLANGEDELVSTVVDPTGAATTTKTTVRIDTEAPHNVKIIGLPEDHQLGEGSYTVEAEATDGAGTTRSSGIAHMALLVDGAEVGEANGSCTPGPCTASGRWTLTTTHLGVGSHTLEVVATDGAGNETVEASSLHIYPSTPVSLGPGEANPTSGEFDLTSTDVSLAGLQLNRSYDSEDLEAGKGGPLGPQWSLSLAGEQSLVEQPNGNVVITGASGAPTTFTDTNGVLAPSAADSNLSLEVDEEGYLLSNAATASRVQFTPPTNGQYTPPSYFTTVAQQMLPSDAVAINDGVRVVTGGETLQIRNYDRSGKLIAVNFIKVGKGPGYSPSGGHDGIAIGARGELWVADSTTNQIYDVVGNNAIQTIGFKHLAVELDGIAIAPDGKIWVAERKANYLQALYQDGHMAGGAAVSEPSGVAVDSSGNIWVTDQGEKDVEEFNASAEYLRSVGQGDINGAPVLETPSGVAVDSHNDIWVADASRDHIVEFNERGEESGKLGHPGIAQGAMNHPGLFALTRDGTIWVAEGNGVSEWRHTQYMPHRVEGAAASRTIIFGYEAEQVQGETVIRPTEVLAPAAQGVSCGEVAGDVNDLKAGCRALTFNYAASTTAVGDAPTEWGDHAGNLTRVYYTAWDPTTKAMKTSTIAQYAFDALGRLRAEWDPRIEPEPDGCAKEPIAHGCLATVYGYDPEGHLTAMTPSHQEPWLIGYGTTAGDVATGRVIGVSRPKATVASTVGLPPVNTAVPQLSDNEPRPGTELRVATGEWNGEPHYYTYRWYDCERDGGKCESIPGAVNSAYTPSASDGGHSLRAEVTATNGAGTAEVMSASTATLVARAKPFYQAAGQAVTSGVTTSFTGTYATLWTPHNGATLESLTCTGVNGSGTMAGNGEGTIELSLLGCSAHGNEGCKLAATPTLAATTKLAYGEGTEGDEEPATALVLTMASAHAIHLSGCRNLGTVALKVSGTATSAIEEPDTETAGHKLKVGEGDGDRLYELEGKLIGTALAIGKGYGTLSIVASALYANEQWSTPPGARIDYPAGKTPEPSYSGEGALTTVEYGVPTRGVGAPSDLSEEEAKRWAQTDVPVEATAVFPPEEPQGWPAANYKHATVYYRDKQGRTVNVLTPGGGVATTEYNEHNDVIRALSADNRAAALNEGAASAAASERWDTTSSYSEDGTELLSTLGPEHLVKLEDGKEVEGRSHAIYSYDEGAPEEGGPYRLVTKVTQGVVAGGEEHDVRQTTRSYGGQKGLGWELRQPTSMTVDPAGLALKSKTVYDPASGSVVETSTPAGNAETVAPPAFAGTFGSPGNAPGQFNQPSAVAVDGEGNVWVDDRGNDRLEKFSASGTFLASYGSEGSGDGQLKGSWGLAINRATGDLYVSDSENNRIEEFDSSGHCLREFGTTGEGALSEPTSITVDSDGNVWVADLNHGRVVEFSYDGEFLRAIGRKGSEAGQLEEPAGVVVSEGEVFVSDYKLHRVEEFTQKGAFLASFGTQGRGPGQFEHPASLSANLNTGDLYVADAGGERIQELTPAGKYLTEFGAAGEGAGQFEVPAGFASAPDGTLYATDMYGDRVEMFVPAQAGGTQMRFSMQFGTKGSGEAQFDYPAVPAIDGGGNLWVTDMGNDRVVKLTPQGHQLASYGSAGTGDGQFRGPGGIAINKSTGDVYVADDENNRIQELSSEGAFIRAFGSEGDEPGELKHPTGVALDSEGNVWVCDYSNNRIEEYSAGGAFIAAYGSKGSAPGQFDEPAGLAIAKEEIYVADAGNDRIDELNLAGEYLGQIGTEGNSGGQFMSPEGVSVDAAGNLYVLDSGNNRVQELSPEGKFLMDFSSHGSSEAQLNASQGLAIGATGALYVTDAGNDRIEKWLPAAQAVHHTKTVYYTAGEEASVAECRNHPEWTLLACRIEPGAQPEAEGLPSLPITTFEYNMYGEAIKVARTVGAASRTETLAYDEAGRPISDHISSSSGVAMPSVADHYNPETGVLDEQSTEGEEGPQAIKSQYDSRGLLTSYTDADGNATIYSYDADERLQSVDYAAGERDGLNAAQTYSYDETTGELSELQDSAAGIFRAIYDAEGNMTSQSYPNGMIACYGYDHTGEDFGRLRQGRKLQQRLHLVQRHGGLHRPRAVGLPAEHDRGRELQLRRRRPAHPGA